jgi:WD40 repeat protein
LITTDAGELQRMAFSANGKLFATAHANAPEPTGGTLQIWNVETGAIAQSIPLEVPPGQNEVAIKDLAFSPDGLMIGLINQDSAFVWLLSDGKLRTQKSLAPSKLTSIGFFPAGEILILGVSSGGNNDGVMSWDMQRNVQRGFLRVDSFGSDSSFPIFAMSKDLSVMVTLNGNSIRRYSIQTARMVNSAILPKFLGEEDDFKRLVYSPSGQYAMASVPGRRPLIWQDSDYDREAILGETAFVGAYAEAFTPDSKSVLQLDRPENTDLEASAAVIRTGQIRE